MLHFIIHTGDFSLTLTFSFLHYFPPIIISCWDFCRSLLTGLPSSSSTPASSILGTVASRSHPVKNIRSLIPSLLIHLFRGKTNSPHCLQSSALSASHYPSSGCSPSAPAHHSGLLDAPGSCLACSCLSCTCCSLCLEHYLHGLFFLSLPLGLSQLSHPS